VHLAAVQPGGAPSAGSGGVAGVGPSTTRCAHPPSPSDRSATLPTPARAPRRPVSSIKQEGRAPTGRSAWKRPDPGHAPTGDHDRGPRPAGPRQGEHNRRDHCGKRMRPGALRPLGTTHIWVGVGIRPSARTAPAVIAQERAHAAGGPAAGQRPVRNLYIQRVPCELLPLIRVRRSCNDEHPQSARNALSMHSTGSTGCNQVLRLPQTRTARGPGRRWLAADGVTGLSGHAGPSMPPMARLARFRANPHCADATSWRLTIYCCAAPESARAG